MSRIEYFRKTYISPGAPYSDLISRVTTPYVRSQGGKSELDMKKPYDLRYKSYEEMIHYHYKGLDYLDNQFNIEKRPIIPVQKPMVIPVINFEPEPEATPTNERGILQIVAGGGTYYFDCTNLTLYPSIPTDYPTKYVQWSPTNNLVQVQTEQVIFYNDYVEPRTVMQPDLDRWLLFEIETGSALQGYSLFNGPSPEDVMAGKFWISNGSSLWNTGAPACSTYEQAYTEAQKVAYVGRNPNYIQGPLGWVYITIVYSPIHQPPLMTYEHISQPIGSDTRMLKWVGAFCSLGIVFKMYDYINYGGPELITSDPRSLPLNILLTQNYGNIDDIYFTFYKKDLSL